MAEFRFEVGDRVRSKRTFGNSGVRIGDLGTITEINGYNGFVRMDESRVKEPIEGRSDGAHWSFGTFSSWFELVDPPATAGEKMIPASKVREIARLYAERHGWCGVVDDALREMGAEDDTMVEVTYTQTRTVRLRRSDLDKLVSGNDLHSLQSNLNRRDQMFRGRNAPSGSSLTSKWTVSEPVEVELPTESSGSWIPVTRATDLQRGDRLRFRSDSPRNTVNGSHVRDGVRITVRVAGVDNEGDVSVDLSGSGSFSTNYIASSRLEVFRPQG